MTHTLKIPITLTEYDNMTHRRIDQLIRTHTELMEEEAKAVKKREQEAARKQARQTRINNRRKY